MSESSRYDDHRQRHGFKNTNPEFRDPSAWERLRFVATRTWGTAFHPRTSPLAPAANDGALLRDNDTAATITWIGHATFLIQLDGLNILTDPHWSERASPVGFAGPKRLVAPGLRFEDLPRIHLVLISHDHYDHLDIQTVWRVAQAHRPLFLVPLGLKRWFGDRQIQNVEEFDWWESRKFEDGVMTCVPAQHFSGRTLWDHNRRLWSGWSVQGRRQHFFFAGDTGYYRDLFTEMTRRLNPIDLAAIPIGAYLPPSMMQFVHSTPEQALQIFSDLHADRFVAMHWGTFDLADEPVGEPPERLHAERQRLGLNEKRIWIMSPGETRPW